MGEGPTKMRRRQCPSLSSRMRGTANPVLRFLGVHIPYTIARSTDVRSVRKLVSERGNNLGWCPDVIHGLAPRRLTEGSPRLHGRRAVQSRAGLPLKEVYPSHNMMLSALLCCCELHIKLLVFFVVIVMVAHPSSSRF